jgi:hypothetical protein
LKIDVTGRCKELLHDGLIPISGRDMQRRDPTLVLNVDATGS